MTKGFRLFVLSALVLAALGFSAIGAMALAPVTRTDLPTSSVTPEPKDEIGGTVTATEVTSTEPAGTVEPVDPKDSMSTPEPVETETARPDRNSSTDMNHGNSLSRFLPASIPSTRSRPHSRSFTIVDSDTRQPGRRRS